MSEQNNSCFSAKDIVEYAIAGKVWIRSCLKQYEKDSSDEISINGIHIRTDDLQRLLKTLTDLQKAKTNQEIDDLICKDMIPVGLLRSEALWQQFQDLIDIRCRSDHSYHPKPIDTSDVTLPEELISLTEKIAENVHDVWAVGRINEGWVYGEKKDAEKKTTPLLIPYDELPESEKDYDRNTAFETLKLIIKMGYRIEKD